MGEAERNRLLAWAAETRRVHQRLRDALAVTREALDDGGSPDDWAAPSRDLLLFCRGFCSALSGHHRGEDDVLFPALLERHPDLADVIYYLRQDHRMIEHLLGGLQQAIERRAGPVDLGRHLDGVSAVMESHFGYEERQLLGVLETLALDADPSDVLGPLA